MEQTANQPADDIRGNTYTKLRRRFYEPLLLIRILEPTQGADAPQPAVDSSSRGQEHLWRKYVDGLAWLCDHERGGATVSAVAVESRPSGLVFWLATSSVTAPSHLQWILNELSHLYKCSIEDQAAAVQRITGACIVFSRKKAKNYTQRLYKSIRRITQDETKGSSEDLTQSFEGVGLTDNELSYRLKTSLMESLRSMLELENDQHHLEACTMAYALEENFRSSTLGQVMPSFEENYDWQQVRHYIGRLGSWKRTVRTLVRLCSTYSHFARDFSVEHLAIPPPVAAPPAGRKTTLEAAAGRIFSASEPERRQEFEKVLLASRVLNLQEAFVNEYKSETFKPHVHAELLLLEHFYQNDLEFAGHERYIGCSKASCYCCGLYMRYHPANVPLRSGHGNVWCNWEPPLGFGKDHEEQYKHTAGILDQMTAYMRRDIIRLAKSKLAKRQRQPDSSTNITEHLMLDDATSRTGRLA